MEVSFICHTIVLLFRKSIPYLTGNVKKPAVLSRAGDSEEEEGRK
jgi:hypothetical protein